MKKIPLFIALFSLLGGFCFAQSNNVADYAVEDIYMYYGKLDEIGTINGTAYSFVNEPIFANENEGLFDALLNKKLVPSVLLKTLPISIPITMKFEKDEKYFDGYHCIDYTYPEDYKKYDAFIKEVVDDRQINWRMLDIPAFLREFKNDNRSFGTIVTCEGTLFFSGRDVPIRATMPFTYKATIVNAKGKKKKTNRTIMVLILDEPKFKILDEGSIIEIAEPTKESIETPFGMVEVHKRNLKLKTQLKDSVTITSPVAPAELTIFTDYKASQASRLQTKDELFALYQTRNGYELKSDVCARVAARDLTEKGSDFYLDSVHLLCTDAVWESLHADIVKKDFEKKYIIDLRLIDGKVQFAVARAKDVYTQNDLNLLW